MSRWFRFYDGTLDDPKVQRLSDKLYRTWTQVLCVACRCGGKLPGIDDIAFMMRLSAKETYARLGELRKAGLIDDDPETGTRPHNWDGRQFQSDESTGRVGKYRDRRRAAGLPILADYTKFREQLIARDGERCVYCEAIGKLVVDHMVPIALGGSDDINNLALACKPCNSGKAGRTPELSGMSIRVTTAAVALARYRDMARGVTVTVTPPDTDTDTDTDTDRKNISDLPNGKSSAPNGATGPIERPKEKPKRQKPDDDPTLNAMLAEYDDVARSLSLPQTRGITSKREGLLRARAHDLVHIFGFPDPLIGMRAVMAKIRASPFLCDRRNRWMGLDWILNETNFLKIMEGTYEKGDASNGFSLHP